MEPSAMREPPDCNESRELNGCIAAARLALDEHHLAAWSNVESRQDEFAEHAACALRRLGGTQVCTFRGECVHNLETFCGALGAATGFGPVRCRLNGRRGIVSALRHRPPANREGLSVKRRYYIWRRADVFAVSRPTLFAELIETFAGIAAEAEFWSEEPLLLHRVLLVGGSITRDSAWNCGRSWRPDAIGTSSSDRSAWSSWEWSTALARPPVLTMCIDTPSAGAPTHGVRPIDALKRAV